MSVDTFISCAASYVDNYLDSVENLPGDIQRIMSRIRDIDVQYRIHLRDVDHYYELFKSMQNTSENTASRKHRSIARIQQNLIQAQELNDEKMELVQTLQELIDQKTRQLDVDQKSLDIKEEHQQQQLRETSYHQHQVHAGNAAEDLGINLAPPMPTKHARTQSPVRGIGKSTEQSSSMATTGNNLNIVGSGGSSSSGGAGGSSPNSERSIGNARLSGSSASNGSNNHLINSSVASTEGQRGTLKRSRRRNDNVSGNSSHNAIMNLEFTGNESGSATECVGMTGSGNDRKNSMSVGSHKKNSQNTSGNVAMSGSNANSTGKKKKRKARGAGANSAQAVAQANARNDDDAPEPIDPDEPTYCVCNQISFGEMILCDNDLCPIEWFHFSCVSLVLKPKGKWYCPNCRGDRPNVMKPKSQFLKELERYNKEKEEKT